MNELDCIILRKMELLDHILEIIQKMPNCPGCGKPVILIILLSFNMSNIIFCFLEKIRFKIYRSIAERVTSIGKDWHRSCLRCENIHCRRTLIAGGHSEHQGKPYCNQCYGALFGPKGYGHGGSESHTFHNGLTGRAN
ncbi:unnamed protein product [Dracunculus medinensis]|uniref:Cysteine-rich protein 1 n=1 Tax=Dracunculus medinensis TaxID=318479 RepID=A0A0N4ULW8_DRAME|nr:unnamed protein product [Dracunculus medinensis]